MKMLYELKRTKDKAIEESKVAIAAKGLSKIENDRLVDIERQFTAIGNRLNEMAKSAMGGNSDIYEATVNQLTYEQGLLQTEWEKLMDKKQETTAMESQLKVFIEIINTLEEEPENYGADEEDNKFRNDIFLQIIERGLMHNDGMVDFELKCGITRTAKAHIKIINRK